MTTSEKFIEKYNLKITPRQLGHLLMAFQGDGHFDFIKKENRIRPVFSGNIPYLEFIKSILIRFPKKNCYKGNIRKGAKTNILYTPASFIEFLSLYGITNKENKMIVSPQLRAENNKFKYGGVSGAFATDGYLGIYTKPAKKRVVAIQQTDQDPDKLLIKKIWLEFIQEIFLGVGLKFSLLNYYKKIAGFSKNPAYVWTLSANFKSNERFMQVFADYFVLHHPKKDVLIKRMANQERTRNQIKNYQKQIRLLRGQNNE